MNLNNEVMPEAQFHLADGRVIKSVPELLEAIRNMEDWLFRHHVNESKNDFMNWINYVAQA